MREVTIKLFTIGELSEEAQNKAYSNWRGSEYYTGDGENRKTLDAFARLFRIRVKNWEYGAHGGYVKFYFTDDNNVMGEMSGIRLLKWLYNNIYEEIFPTKYYWGKKTGKKRRSKIMREANCPLTGYCIDEDILEPIYRFLERPDDTAFYDLLDQCFESWAGACSRDVEFCLSFENFMETAEINGYEYLGCGNFFHYHGGAA